MAWPQAPQPAPAPAAAGPSLPLGPIITAAGGLLTFLFSFVQIVKADSEFVDAGLSVWTTDPGFFGIGTWIPLFALLAGAAALARGFAKGLGDKQVLGFGLLQVQLAAVAFAVLLWLGYMVNIVMSEFVTFGLGAFLLFLGLAAVVAGTGLSVLDARKGTTTTISAATGPPSGQWGAPAGPPPDPSGQWPQPTPPPPPQQQWPAPPPPPPPPAQPGPGQWPQQPAPGQWQPDPAGAPAPPQQWQPSPGGPEQAWQPPTAPTGPDPYQPQPAPPGPVPEPGPLDPQPAPPIDPQPGPAPAGGGLFDPGTQVIPGPPPAPPSDHVGGGPDAIPPSNTP